MHAPSLLGKAIIEVLVNVGSIVFEPWLFRLGIIEVVTKDLWQLQGRRTEKFCLKPLLSRACAAGVSLEGFALLTFALPYHNLNEFNLF